MIPNPSMGVKRNLANLQRAISILLRIYDRSVRTMRFKHWSSIIHLVEFDFKASQPANFTKANPATIIRIPRPFHTDISSLKYRIPSADPITTETSRVATM